MSEVIYTRDDLVNLVPHHSSIVCIDSDGCVFDTMTVKQTKFFHGQIIKQWNLQAIEKELRQTAEFVNLYSKWRGINRFLALQKVFDLLRKRQDVKAAGVTVPDFPSMDAFIASGIPLGNPTIEQEVKKTGDKELACFLDWSKKVNADIDQNMGLIPPFKGVMESLEMIKIHSDAIVVSQTPTEALVKEWRENNIDDYISVIAGQELGTKAEHIEMATKGKYSPRNIFMIGDAPGDKKAAKANSALFYPINPGREEESWERFHQEAYKKFLEGTYAGEYEKQVVSEFDALLPETPPWK